MESEKNNEKREATMPEDLCYLYGSWFQEYLHDVEICQRFARRNRERIAEVLLGRTGMAGGEAFHTIHNYIDTEEMILRKGAIAAHAGEKVLIPINMRDGSILAVGRGNPDWNYSAPHGAGRIMSRAKAKSTLSMEEYRAVMEGVYTTSVNEATLDEAPMAYKSLEDIMDVIGESAEVTEVLKPIYFGLRCAGSDSCAGRKYWGNERENGNGTITYFGTDKHKLDNNCFICYYEYVTKLTIL